MERPASRLAAAEADQAPLGRLKGMFSGQGPAGMTIGIGASRGSAAAPRADEEQVELELLLPTTIVDHLRREAARKGVSEAKIASILLETIARDDLYEAVLGSK